MGKLLPPKEGNFFCAGTRPPYQKGGGQELTEKEANTNISAFAVAHPSLQRRNPKEKKASTPSNTERKAYHFPSGRHRIETLNPWPKRRETREQPTGNRRKNRRKRYPKKFDAKKKELRGYRGNPRQAPEGPRKMTKTAGPRTPRLS